MNRILLLSARDVGRELRGHEDVVLDIVSDCYRLHEQGRTAVPHSAFLRFPGDTSRRIVSCPAFVDGPMARAGVKWIASFPGNVEQGLDRASAIIVLNSTRTGRPEAILEGTGVSAVRTAASAALAARTLRPAQAFDEAGLIGCGVINLNVLRYLRAIGLPIERVTVHDLDARRARSFARACEAELPGLRTEVAEDASAVLNGHQLVSMATTASRPHIDTLDRCPAGALILHISLRDLAPTATASCDNVVDDVDHVCRERTSLHLAEQLRGDRSFIRCTLGQVLTGRAPPHPDDRAVTVFSPFGLGALDVAVGGWVTERAAGRGAGTPVEDFFAPAPEGRAIHALTEAP